MTLIVGSIGTAKCSKMLSQVPKVPVVLAFYRPMPRVTEFSDQATTDRGWVSGNTSGYKVGASMFSTVA